VAWSLLAAYAVVVAALVGLAVANGTLAFQSFGDTVACCSPSPRSVWWGA
jgi:hypothetical protein